MFEKYIMVMVMEVVKIDKQGRVVIPKSVRERKGLKGEIELVETDEGIILRPLKARTWDSVLSKKVSVNWDEAVSVSLDNISMDELLYE